MKKANFILLEGLTCCGKGVQTKKIKKYIESRGVSARIYAEPTPNGVVGIMIRNIIEKRPIEKSFIENYFIPEIDEYVSTLSNSGIFLKGPECNDVVREFVYTLQSAKEKVRKQEKLSNRELQSLYVVDRHFDLVGNIIRELQKGIWVIQDRYDRSTMAFGEAFGGITIEEVYKWHLHILGEEYIFPYFDFYIRIQPETAMARLQKDGKTKDQFEGKLEGLRKTAEAYEEANAFMNEQYALFDPPHNQVFVINGEQSEDDVFRDIVDVFKHFDVF